MDKKIGHANMKDRDHGMEALGEDNDSAIRHYNESNRTFIEAGQVEKDTKQAAPHNNKEAQEQEAEWIGKAHSQAEDPSLFRTYADYEEHMRHHRRKSQSE